MCRSPGRSPVGVPGRASGAPRRSPGLRVCTGGWAGGGAGGPAGRARRGLQGRGGGGSAHRAPSGAPALPPSLAGSAVPRPRRRPRRGFRLPSLCLGFAAASPTLQPISRPLGSARGADRKPAGAGGCGAGHWRGLACPRTGGDRGAGPLSRRRGCVCQVGVDGMGGRGRRWELTGRTVRVCRCGHVCAGGRGVGHRVGGRVWGLHVLTHELGRGPYAHGQMWVGVYGETCVCRGWSTEFP